MKKFIALIISLVLIFSFTACAGVAAPSQEDDITIISSADATEQAVLPEQSTAPVLERSVVEEVFDSGGYGYTAYSDDTATITRCRNDDTELLIPA